MSVILVTGASGYIGKHIVKNLDFPDGIVFSRLALENINSKQYVIEDIASFSKVLRSFDCLNTVLHLAALAHNKSDSIDEYLRVNYTEALNFAEKAAEHGCNKFIYLSTVNVYGYDAVARPFKEDCIGSGLDIISEIRLKFESSLIQLGRDVGMQVIILRCPLVYSLSAPANFGKFIKFTSKSRVLPFGSFKAKRSYLSLNNLLSAVLTVIASESRKSGIYNLSDDYDISIKDMSSLIANYHNTNPLQIYLPQIFLKLFDYFLRSNRLSRLFLTPFQIDCDKFKFEFNWQPIETPYEHFTPTEKS